MRASSDPRPGAWSRTSAPVLALAFVAGLLTALLGTGAHLWREPVLGVPLPMGLVLALLLVLATDLAVALATRRAAALFAVAAGRTVLLGIVLFPSGGGDVVITGGLASTVWVLLAVLLPSFLAPLVAAVTAGRVRAQPPRAATAP